MDSNLYATENYTETFKICRCPNATRFAQGLAQLWLRPPAQNPLYPNTVYSLTELFKLGYSGGFLPCTERYIRNRNNSYARLLQDVVYKSRPHPKIPSLLKSPLLSLNKLVHSDIEHFGNLFSEDENSWLRGEAWEVAFQKYFFAEQNSLILEDLKNCSKSAWVLPWANANKISSSLRKMGYHMDVGKENYFTGDTILTLSGFVRRHIVSKYALILESGIFNWWHDVVISLYSSKENPNLKPVKPRMNGNILVIFILWLAGLGFSAVLFGAEKWVYFGKTRIVVMKLYLKMISYAAKFLLKM